MNQIFQYLIRTDPRAGYGTEQPNVNWSLASNQQPNANAIYNLLPSLQQSTLVPAPQQHYFPQMEQHNQGWLETGPRAGYGIEPGQQNMNWVPDPIHSQMQAMVTTDNITNHSASSKLPSTSASQVSPTRRKRHPRLSEDICDLKSTKARNYNKKKRDNQEPRAMVAALQAQMAQLVKTTEVSSDAEIINVEKVDEEKVTNSVENVSNIMPNATISREPIDFSKLYNFLNDPLTIPPNQALDQQHQADPPLIVKKDKTTIQYASKPGLSNLDDDLDDDSVRNPAHYQPPLFNRIVYQFYGDGPIRLHSPVPSTSQENQNLSNLDDDSVRNPAHYHSPLLSKIVYQFYGDSPISSPVPSTSKENQNVE